MEKRLLDFQLDNLKTFACILDDVDNVAVTFKMNMTLIDGKVLNVLTGTKSTQCCPICGVTPTKVLETKDFSLTPKLEALHFGVSPLHAWIRFLEFVLNITVDGSTRSGEARKRACEDNYYI